MNVYGNCEVAGHETDPVSFTACDLVGHCTIETVTPPAPQESIGIVIVDPAEGTTVSAGVEIAVSGTAFAPLGVAQVILSEGAAFIGSVSFGIGIIDTAWSTPWTPSAVGTSVLTAQVIDHAGFSTTDSIRVKTKLSLIADDQTVSTNEDTSVDITLTGKDPEGQPLTFVIKTLPTNGTLFDGLTEVTTTTVLSGDTVTYVPDPDFDGTDTFEFVTNDGASDSDVATVTINVVPVNAPPTVSADSTSVSVDEGETAVNSGSFADIDDGDSVTTTVNVGSISQAGTQNGTWSWSFVTSDGPAESQTVTVTATDIAGGQDTINFALVVDNVDPSVAADNASVTVDEGQTAANTGTFSDPGDDDPTISTSVGTVSKSGTNDGTWIWSFDTSDGPSDSQAVTITANDGEGGISATDFVMSVQNVAPVAAGGPDQTANEGEVVSFYGSASDPGTNDIYTYEWDFEYDGVTFDVDATGQNVTHVYSDDWIGDVALRVTDDDGGVDIDIAIVNILNVAPTANAGGPYTVGEGSSVALRGSGTDPGLDTLTYAWDLDNDGAFETAGQNPTFSAAGRAGPDTQTVVLRVCDDDGACATDTATVDTVVATCDGQAATIVGTPGDDRIYGTAGDDVIHGLGGNDEINGMDGNDVICGGEGDDMLKGKDGEDKLFGQEGNDRLYGGDDNDTIFGGPGADVAYAGEGDDQVDGDEGDDELRGEAGNDTLAGGDGDDFLKGGSGDDIASGGPGDDRFYGRDGNDIFDGGPGVDVAYGGRGNDILRGGDDDDRLRGEEGDDWLIGGAGNDFLKGSDGADRGDGGDGDDTFYGGDGNDRFAGGNGAEIAYGDDGNDHLIGGTGPDKLKGYGGDDICDGSIDADADIASSSCKTKLNIP